ncbi:hypothetical protein PISMIDRAFT_686927, partial [Pisolithus microcarpus 441]
MNEFKNDKRYRNKCRVVEVYRLGMAMNNFGKRTRIRKSASATDMMVWNNKNF